MSNARRASTVLVASILIAACGSPSVPAGSAGTGSPAIPGPSGTGAAGATTGPGGNDAVARIVTETLIASVAEVAQAENAFAEDVARAAGLPAHLGQDNWDWANQLLHDELEKAGQSVTLTGEASQMASLGDGPPRAAFGGAGGIGLAMAASFVHFGMQGSSNPFANNSGNVTSTQTTTANGERSTGTVTFNMQMSTSGSTVEGDISIGVDVSVADATTGAVLRTGSFQSRGSIKLDFCPDANGKVRGHVTMTMSGGTSGAGSASIDVEADIEGTVGDDAYLNQVDISGASSQQTTASGSASPRTVQTQMRYTSAVSRTGGLTLNPSSATGQGTGPADLTDAEVNAGYQQIVSAAAAAVWTMGDAAQAKWRGGACVEVRATEQSRDVMKNETVQFESKVWHKIENVELNKNIVNTFAGKTSIDPVDIPVPAPVTNSFKAGPNSNDIGTITMTSTSNRGIGEQTLTFRVKGGWLIDYPATPHAYGGGSLHGEKCGDPTGNWVIDGSYDAAGFTGEQGWVITINADERTGVFEYATYQTAVMAGVKIYLEGTANGTATLDIDATTGIAKMHLQETKHTYRSWTEYSPDKGKNTDTELFAYEFEWLPEGSC